jgi:hypothetical protein
MLSIHSTARDNLPEIQQNYNNDQEEVDEDEEDLESLLQGE